MKRVGMKLFQKSKSRRSWDLAAITDTGTRRSVNEDAALAEVLSDGRILLAVADGVGGASAGEVASGEALQALRMGVEGAEGDAGEQVLEAFRAANRRVRELAASDDKLTGMASTLVAAIVTGNAAIVTNLGDSRAYLLRHGELHQLTRDHSWVAEQVSAGALSAAEAERSQYRNVITRGIGADDEVQPEQNDELELADDSVLLLCSDGLFKAVKEERIAELLEWRQRRGERHGPG